MMIVSVSSLKLESHFTKRQTKKNDRLIFPSPFKIISHNFKKIQKWRNHVHGISDYTLPRRRIFNYKPQRKRDLERPRKRWFEHG
jgi:hypothetical protein